MKLDNNLSYLMLVWLPLSLCRLNKELAAVCIETMKANSTVKKLLLRLCNIDDASAYAHRWSCLAIKLEMLVLMHWLNSTLISLGLSRNQIGDVGAVALKHTLKKNILR